MKVRRRAGALVAAATAVLLTSCGSGGLGAVAGNDGPTVLASFYPLAYTAERVVGPDATVENLTPYGVDAHDLELTGQQVARIADADLVMYLGGFQPAVDEAVAQNAADRSLDVATLLELLEAEPSNASDDRHTDDGHEHGDLDRDPHIWLDPTNLAPVADAIADRLGELLPDRADALRDRADELERELDDLDEEFRSGLAECKRRTFVTSHAAFGYLAHRYDLEMVSIAGIEPDAEPSPARVAEVQRLVQNEGLTTIFYERLVSPAVAESLAADLGVTTAVLDTIEGLTDETADDDYFSLMRANLDALREANGCT